MKPLIDRIQYYARKANQYGRSRYDYFVGRSAKKPPANRHARLMAYKAAVHRRYLGI
ncbi:hypothetical protein [Paenibacillus sp. DMB20]|uniref:hypothetical protein n=1 Tax=Paenibacillus sp. DMB20 TaxID=1642570 RepID=UPI000AB24380|nr:hypothetical protein [Paenibacillus sp. DMB20]